MKRIYQVMATATYVEPVIAESADEAKSRVGPVNEMTPEAIQKHVEALDHIPGSFATSIPWGASDEQLARGRTVYDLVKSGEVKL